MIPKLRHGAVITAVVAVALLTGAVAAGANALRTDDERDDARVEDAREGPDQPITGPALAEAESAALAHVGGGTVTGTEVADEESYYEVEVTLDDGSQIDVQLDRRFQVVDTN